MNAISNLRYVTIEGLEAPVDMSHQDNPYHGVGKSEFGRRVANSFIRKIRWETGSIRHEIEFHGGVIAAQDPSANLIVIQASSLDIPEPNNAIVLNPDGTFNHKILAPPYVERTIEQLPNKAPVTKKYPVEYIAEVLVQNGRVLIGLNFGYEWIERRYYDPSTQRWQERDQVYRK